MEEVERFIVQPYILPNILYRQCYVSLTFQAEYI